MTPIEALRRFERALIPIRTTAGQVESWEDYRTDWLPLGTDPKDENLIAQGFAAGYDAAMNRVRATLAGVQTQTIREG